MINLTISPLNIMVQPYNLPDDVITEVKSVYTFSGSPTDSIKFKSSSTIDMFEPLFRAVATEQFIDQILKVLCHHRTVVDDVLRLNKVEAVM